MSPARQRKPTDEELRLIAAGGTVESEVMSWLAEHDPDGELLAQAGEDTPASETPSEPESKDATTPRRPSPAEMHRIADGRRVDPAVERWLKEEDDGSVKAEIDRIKSDAGLLAELAAVHKERVTPGKSMLDAPTPDGYEILREIDRGAQGAVYLARQVAAKRDVALKVLLQGSFATERQQMRFEREVEVVASLKHPCIVTLYDSGLTDEGNAFLAMEFIDGAPLTSFRVESGDDQRRKPTLAEKAELFIDVCEAVGYAHQRGIIHRDLKPANILVDHDGQPHILDFGLAKAVESDNMTESKYEMTAAGEFMGTFAYASPEQVSGDPDAVDTRTDVYALGVLLYELVLGERPYRVTGSIAQMVKAIIDEPPVPPQSIDDSIDQDLETILLRALDKDVDRRYQSPGALAADVRHWLRGEAIEARRDDAWYVARKYLRRHWIPVSAIASGMVVLAVFAVFMTVLWERADHFNRTSDRMLLAATELLGNMDPENPDTPMSARSQVEVMQRWAAIINENFTEFPDVLARLNIDLAVNFTSLNQPSESRPLLDDVLSHYRSKGEADSAELAFVLHHYARTLFFQKIYEDSEETYQQAFEMRRRHLGEDHVDTLETMQHYGYLLGLNGKVEESDAILNEALTLYDQQLATVTDASEQKALGNGRLNVMNTIVQRNLLDRPELALPVIVQILADFSRNSDSEEPDWRVANVLSSAGLARLLLDDLDGAQRDLERAQEYKEFLGSPVRIANGQVLLARLAIRQDRLDDAREWIEAARAERLSRLPPTASDVRATEQILAEILLRQGHVDEAKPLVDDIAERTANSRDVERLVMLDRLRALEALAQDAPADAASRLTAAWVRLETADKLGHPLARTVARELAAVLDALGQAEDAETFRMRAQPPAVIIESN
ncbi:MAG: protein kinase [Phycisphaerales bacterium]|nr:protein kinase [Phycisphaerales bacterium]